MSSEAYPCQPRRAAGLVKAETEERDKIAVASPVQFCIQHIITSLRRQWHLNVSTEGPIGRRPHIASVLSPNHKPSMSLWIPPLAILQRFRRMGKPLLCRAVRLLLGADHVILNATSLDWQAATQTASHITPIYNSVYLSNFKTHARMRMSAWNDGLLRCNMPETISA